MFLLSKTKGVPALCKEMDLRGDTCSGKGLCVHGAVADPIHWVVPGLQQEGGWRLLGHVNAGIESGTGAAQMARIERDGKVRTTAHLVNGIDLFISGRD